LGVCRVSLAVIISQYRTLSRNIIIPVTTPNCHKSLVEASLSSIQKRPATGLPTENAAPAFPSSITIPYLIQLRPMINSLPDNLSQSYPGSAK